jgi:hypothetical protein
MNLQSFQIFIAISTYSVLIPSIVYLSMIKKLPKANHIIGIYVMVAAGCDVVVSILFHQKASNVIPINIYFVSTFLLISYFYFELIFKKRLRYVAACAVIIYLSTAVFSFISLGVDQYLNSLWALGAFIIGGYGIIYIINLQDMVVDRLLDKDLYSYRIINASFLSYFLVTLLLFISTNYVFTEADVDTSRIFWSFHNIANTLKNIGLAVGLYYTGRRDVKTTLLEIEKIGRERSGELHDEVLGKSLGK